MQSLQMKESATGIDKNTVFVEISGILIRSIKSRHFFDTTKKLWSWSLIVVVMKSAVVSKVGKS